MRSGRPARNRSGVARLVPYLFSAGVLGWMGAGAGQQLSVFRARGDLVRVFVTVTDRDGRLITTLRQDDFEIRDRGKPQPITQFDSTPLPIRLIVMLDASGSMEGNLPLLRTAAAQLFSRLGPDDVARVGAFGHEITISPAFTHDPDELQAALPQMIDPDAPTFLWRALDAAIHAFGDMDDKRRVIVVLSDGKDSGPHAFFGQRALSQAEVTDRASREDIMIYAIGMRSRGRPQRIDRGNCGATAPLACLQAVVVADDPDPGLARVAQATGGGYTEIDVGQDLGRAFAAIADQLHSQYLLGFVPPQRDGKVHSLTVRLTQGGLKPRARKGYVAPKE
jgi:Ca-activated chloride channel homolog